MHGDLLTNDETIGDQFANRLAGVGISDLIYFVGIEPDLALATAYHGGGKALLGTEIDPVKALLVSHDVRSIGGCGLQSCRQFSQPMRKRTH